MRVLMHDMQGYVFVRDLAAGLAGHGHEVAFVTCPSVASPHQRSGKYALGVQTVEVGLASEFHKYDLRRRLQSERQYGRRVSDVIARMRPDIVLSSNAPLLSQHLVARAAHKVGARFVFWLQDLYGAVARQALAERLPDRLAQAAAAPFAALERRLLVTSDHVVTVGLCLARAALEAGVGTARHELIPNWMDPSTIAYFPTPDTNWRRRHHPDVRTLVLYSGTLGKKHPYTRLPQTAGYLPDGAHLAVVSEGLGADWLLEHQAQLPVSVLGYQPEQVVPEMLGSADILVLMLSDEASRYSVPSKLYTYLCAGRPILALVPPWSESADFVREHGVGLVVDVSRPDALRQAIEVLTGDRDLRLRMGTAARAWAEANMDPDVMADAFDAVLQRTMSVTRSPARPRS